MTKALRLNTPRCFSLAAMFVMACNAGSDPDPSTMIDAGALVTDAQPSGSDGGEAVDLWPKVEQEFRAAALNNATLIVGTKTGPLVTYSKGDSNPQQPKKIASASKWVTGLLISVLVQQGKLSFDDHPQKYIPWWTRDPADGRSQVTLAQLMSFTSGFHGDVFSPICLYAAISDPDTCLKRIYDEELKAAPGTTFAYNERHMQIAARMALEATKASTLQQLYDQTLGPLLKTGAGIQYAEPSVENARASSGIVATAAAYEQFLIALLDGRIDKKVIDSMNVDQTGPGVTIVYTPIQRPGQTWHYGTGHWIECQQTPFAAACGVDGIVSSPGALGWYPWVDLKRGYYGLIATEQPLRAGTPVSDESIALGQKLRPLIEAALEAQAKRQ